MIKTKNEIGSTVNRRTVDEREKEEKEGERGGRWKDVTGQGKGGMTGLGMYSIADTSSHHRHKQAQARCKL